MNRRHGVGQILRSEGQHCVKYMGGMQKEVRFKDGVSLKDVVIDGMRSEDEENVDNAVKLADRARDEGNLKYYLRLSG